LVKVGVGGKVCVYSHAESNLVVDVNGYVPAGGTPSSLVPARLLESRAGVSYKTVDGASQGIGVRRAGSVTELKVTGRGGVPSGAVAVMLNVTAVTPSARGYMTVFPCGSPVPVASNLNFAGGDVVANAVLVKVGVGGKVCVYSHAESNLVVDVNGYVPA
jgi:hypothetical protein